MRQISLLAACTSICAVVSLGLAQDNPDSKPVAAPAEWRYVPDATGAMPSWWKQSTSHTPGDPSPVRDPAWSVEKGDDVPLLRVRTNDYSRSTMLIAPEVMTGKKLHVKFRIAKERGVQAFTVVAASAMPERQWHAGVMWIASKPSLLVSSMADGQWAKPKSVPIAFDAAAWHTLDVLFDSSGAQAVMDETTRLALDNVTPGTRISLSLVANAAVVDVKEVALTQWPQTTITLDVTGMHCEMCEANIEGVLEKIKGVKKVTSSYKTGVVSVEVDPASPPSNESLIEAIKALKYSATVHEPGTSAPASPAAAK